MSQKRKDVIGYGQITLDKFAYTTDEFISEKKLNKGFSQGFSPEMYMDIIGDLEFFVSCCGGSGFNVIKGLGFAGLDVGFQGHYSKTKKGGKDIDECFEEYSVTNLSRNKETGFNTSCSCLITPDKQRTMLCLFGISNEPYEEPDDHTIIDGYNYLLIEGYYFCNEDLSKRAFDAIDYALDKGTEVILMLSNVFCVEKFRDSLERVSKVSTIITGNEDEFLSFFGKGSIEELVKHLETQKQYKAIIVTCGPKGAWLIVNQKSYFVSAPNVKVEDTTGAGDFFTAGFLAGYIKGLSPEESGELARIYAGNTISHVGTTLDEEIKLQIKQILG